MARQLGYTEEQLEALDDLGDALAFDPAVTAALLYAERVTRDAHTVTDASFEELRRHYAEADILEITCVVGLANYWNRFSTALRVDLSGTDEPYDPPAAGR